MINSRGQQSQSTNNICFVSRGMKTHDRHDVAIIAPGTVTSVVLGVMLFLTRIQYVWERLAPNMPMAQIYIAVLVAVGFLILLVNNVVFDSFDAFGLLCAVIVALWGLGKYSVLYSSLFLLILLWRKILIVDMTILCRSFVVSGMMFCLLFPSSTGRWLGFSSSPTMFSLILSLAVVYLLFHRGRMHSRRIDFIIAMVGFYLVWKSETRIFMMYLALVVGYYFLGSSVRWMFQKLSPFGRRFIIAIFALIIFCFIALNINYVLELFSRDSGEASTRTRFSLYTAVYKAFVSSAGSVLFGSGGGTAMEVVQDYLGRSTAFPVHQDFILFLSDYGVCGLALILIAAFSRLKWTWYMWLFLFLCTFHNVLSSGVSIVFIVLVFQSLCNVRTCSSRDSLNGWALDNQSQNDSFVESHSDTNSIFQEDGQDS